MRGLVIRILKIYLRLLPPAMIIAFILSILGPSAVQADPGWYDSNWQYRKKITINAVNVVATLTNFPVLISLPSDGDLSTNARSDGFDILFTAADEVSKLSHEIEKYDNATGKLVAWVRIPTLSSVTDTDIYMYYGNAGAANQQSVTAVWDSNFKIVQHLEEATGGANAIKDSTGYNNNGTDVNAPTLGATGKIDGAITFNKASSQYIQLPASNTILNSGDFAIEAWFKTTTNHPVYGVGTMEGRIVNLHRGATAGSAISIYVEQNMVGYLYYSGTTYIWVKYTVNYYDGIYHHIVVTHDTSSNTYRLYFDGVQVASDINTFGSVGTFPSFIGAHDTTVGQRYFNGNIDEVRISNTARSAAWIQTSFNNQSDPATFFLLGPQQTSSGPPPPPPPAIGGTVFSVNKAMVLMPWLLLAAACFLMLYRPAQYLLKKIFPRRRP
jgi:hypothetical protein